MAKLTILTGGYEAAKAWAEVWAQSHSGSVYDGTGLSPAAVDLDDGYDSVYIADATDEIQLLDFSDEVAE